MKLIEQIAQVLLEAQGGLHTRDIAQRVLERFPDQRPGDLERQIYSALDRDIRKNAAASRFVKVKMGTFCLKEFADGPGEQGEQSSGRTGPADSESVQYPTLRFSSASLARISPAGRALPLTDLGLGVRAAGVFKAAGLETIGQIVDAIRSGLGKMKNFGRGAHAETVEAIRALSEAVDEDGGLDLLAYARKRGFPVLPESEGVSFAQLLPVLPEILRQAIEHQFDGPHWTIFQSRWIASPERRKTLEELGVALQVTRARVQQVEEEVFVALRAALLDENYENLRFRFKPEMAQLFRATKDYFADVGQTAWRQSAWLEEFASVHRMQVADLVHLGDLMVELLRFHTRSTKLPDGEKLVFEDACAESEREKTLRVVAAMHKVLYANCLGLDAVDLAGRLASNSQTRIHLDDLPEYASLCPTVEVVAGEIYRLKFAFLKTRGDEAVRVLAASGVPMLREDILRLINKEAGKPISSVINLVNQMIEDPRLCPIGKSGLWALREWGAETGPIADVIEAILTKNGEPMEIGRITEEVQLHRQASPVSVVMYLDLRKERFHKFAPGFYGLSSWVKGGVKAPDQKTYRRRRPLQSELIIQQAVELLKAQPGQAMPLVDVAKELEKTFKVLRNTIYGAISQAAELERVPFADKPGKLLRLKSE